MTKVIQAERAISILCIDLANVDIVKLELDRLREQLPGAQMLRLILIEHRNDSEEDAG